MIAAEVVRDCPASILDTAEREWGVMRLELRKTFAKVGEFAEHAHWDWRRKRDSVASGRHRIAAIQVGETVQGLMAVFGFGRSSKIDPSHELLYVDYFEIAPNNIRRLPNLPHFAPVGYLPMLETIRISREIGFAGRVGLHSLPQAEHFYRERIGCVDLGPDARYDHLRSFEITERLADALLKE